MEIIFIWEELVYFASDQAIHRASIRSSFLNSLLRKRRGREDLSFYFLYSLIMLKYNNNLKHLARELRKNMTDAEKLLWSRISRRQLSGYQFYRQRIIGSYIVDFYCPKARLVIEIDGGQHYSGKGEENDKTRDRRLAGMGLKVLRYSNLDVLKNTDIVLEHIYEILNPPEFGLTTVPI
jgi:very-short-patch-repair endonuclease